MLKRNFYHPVISKHENIRFFLFSRVQSMINAIVYREIFFLFFFLLTGKLSFEKFHDSRRFLAN